MENALILVLALFPFRLPPQTKSLEQAKLIEIAEKYIQENMIWVWNSLTVMQGNFDLLFYFVFGLGMLIMTLLIW